MTEVDLERRGSWGIVTLNRPRALNSLTPAMCAAFDEAIAAWEADPAVRAVLIEGAGERAFCAGGDIRALYEVARKDPQAAADFFRTEYRLNTRLSRMSTPSVALIDGICMGGGVGVSIHAAHRIATERTVWAMPECAIGLVPDVGASFFLNQLGCGLPLYLGLTGARLTGHQCVAAGVATTAAPSNALEDLREALLTLPDPGEAGSIEAVLPASDRSPLPEGDEIAGLFGAVQSVEQVLERLRATRTPLAEGALQRMEGASPTSLALTYRLLTEASGDFAECIAREFRVVAHLMDGPDFIEGVRAQVVEKDRQPRWSPATPEGLTASSLSRYFEAPRGGDLDLSGLL
ncbi:3-hydroxyisobutyryl-CoA hydrolase [Parvularcula dongshanensis]|uniref:3-hydroxyisobutyryl-CoA hydrolase n=1 Tax=Parvularcula dongshanensis TaxID=1173995 RepID=A0A840I5Y9_9PROT|nr:enoyl-CoA hydratase/carnithine racemase [Parvularcula dongshanensis]